MEPSHTMLYVRGNMEPSHTMLYVRGNMEPSHTMLYVRGNMEPSHTMQAYLCTSGYRGRIRGDGNCFMEC